MSIRSLKRPRALVLAAVALLGVTLAFYLPSRGDVAEAAVGRQTFFDDFTGSGAANSGLWNYEIGGGGWGNNEHQYYTAQNAVQQGGNLVITARRENPGNYQCWYGRCEYTSSRLTTSGKFAQAYGKFEARIKIPRGQGIWPAFWMLGQDIGQVGWPQSGEIDIMENVGKEPNTVYGTVHGPGYSGGAGITGSRNIGRPLADDFHTYAVEWAPDYIRWLLDGAEYHRITPATLGGRQWVFNKPHFMILNVAVGGNWPGYPDGSTQFPQQMLVDWVRGNAWDSGPAPTGNRLRQAQSGRCADIPSANAGDGALLQIWDCNTSAAQQWSFVDGTVRAMGKCMDPAWAGTANGTEVNLVTCNGNAVQQFRLEGNRLFNPSSGRCVDVRNQQTSNGGKLHLWDCHGGASQQWSRI